MGLVENVNACRPLCNTTRGSLSLSAFLNCEFSSLQQGQDLRHEGLFLKMIRGGGVSISPRFTWALPWMRMKKPAALQNTDVEAVSLGRIGDEPEGVD